MKDANDPAFNSNSYNNLSPSNTLDFRKAKSGLYFSSVVAGIFAAVGMAVLALFLGEAGLSAPIVLFLKYVVLVPFLIWVLVKQMNILGDSYKFVKGIRQGGLVTLIAATSMALINVFLYSSDTSLEMGNPTEPSNYLGRAFINGGVVFMECLVLGMTITFICLQFLKRGRPGEESFNENSAK